MSDKYRIKKVGPYWSVFRPSGGPHAESTWAKAMDVVAYDIAQHRRNEDQRKQESVTWLDWFTRWRRRR